MQKKLFFCTLLIISVLFAFYQEVYASQYTGKVVGVSRQILAVQGHDGRIIRFAVGWRTKYYPNRLPMIGERVRVNYAYGRRGYTGYSGGGEVSRWIRESVDISSFAGQEIILRFEYITDAAVNGDGLLLDDLSIDAIDYREDFESGDGGWDTAGFVRLYNQLPQTYRLVLIEMGRETRVRELALDENQSAQFELTLVDESSEAVLVVIGTARHTWQPAHYRFQVLP